MNINIVKKVYGKSIVFENFKAELDENKMNFIIGSNGTGKTTLLNIIFGLDTDYEGKVSKDLNYSNIAMIPQDNSLYEKYTVEQVLNVALEYNGTFEENHDLLKGISLDQKINSLSGGQRQRVSIYSALIKKSNVIILDEPTSSLDIDTKKEIITVLNKLLDDKIMLIVVTHDESFINEFENSNIIKINGGKSWIVFY